LPCRGKKPVKDKAIGLEHGWKDATRDLDTIRAWWTRYPRTNIGGACGPSGRLVIDPDHEGLEEWIRGRHKHELPPTLTTLTGGGGKHEFYRVSLDSTIGNLDSTLPDCVKARRRPKYGNNKT
jgi:hypothetical protein